MIVVNQARALLQQYWGHTDFRPQQEDIIVSIVGGRNTIALLPTGGGKSICFQIPALMLDGLTLVISPLIALMNDQVSQLKKKGIRAACIHSNLHYKEIERLLDNAQFGNLKLLYISPERLQSKDFLVRLVGLPISLLAIDEAHCVSMWGYDFRPSYLKIPEVRGLVPGVPTIALTATATSKVLEDIQDKLDLEQPAIYRQTFLRANLKFGVLNVEDKKQQVQKLVRNIEGVKIIYVRNRRQTKDLAMLLSRDGVRAQNYHAGLEVKERNAREQAFLEGNVDVMVATNAFGMGIDKSDVRLVLHYDVPENLEAYYQEAGRAGRDGIDSYAILLYQTRDYERLWHQFEQSFPVFSEIRRLYQALGNYLKLAVGSGAGETFDFDLVQFSQQYRFDVRSAWSALKVMEQAEWFVLSEGVFKPATLKVNVDREALYDYQLRNKSRELLIQALLRLYQGILQDLVPINIGQLAAFLRMSEGALEQSLKDLQQEGIIEYFPKNDRGRITLLLPRTKSENLTIDETLLAFRKQRRKAGLESILQYVDLKECRQRYLVTYFGDDTCSDCGICDNCQRRSQQVQGEQKMPTLSRAILEKLGHAPQTIADLNHAFSRYDKQEILDILQVLMDEEVIEKSDEFISLTN